MQHMLFLALNTIDSQSKLSTEVTMLVNIFFTLTKYLILFHFVA